MRLVGTSQLATDFGDDYLELLRLLHEATEVEHALMLQYLYAAFSLKDKYYLKLGLVADPFTGYTSNNHTLVGVAIQEMQHLREVNEMLVQLGGLPNLSGQDFPYEPDIYPFPMVLEPLSRNSCAKYVYAEAPRGAIDPDSPDPATKEFARKVLGAIAAGGNACRPNRLGSLYTRIVALTESLAACAAGNGWVGPTPSELRLLLRKLDYIKDEGERDHYEFFKSVFLGTHSAFEGVEDIWDECSDSYPSMRLRSGSAYLGHSNTLSEPERLIAWLGNMQYWTALSLLTAHYKHPGDGLNARALDHMFLIRDFARYAASTWSLGLPFDSLSLGHGLGRDRRVNLSLLARFVRESTAATERVARQVPELDSALVQRMRTVNAGTIGLLTNLSNRLDPEVGRLTV